MMLSKKLKVWLHKWRTGFTAWKIRRACRKGKHVGGEPQISLEAAHMREPNGREYSAKIRVQVVTCIYCGHVMDLEPRGIVDARPPVKGSNGQ